MADVEKPRTKTYMGVGSMPPGVVKWLEEWDDAGASSVVAAEAPASSSRPKKRKRMTEAERLRAAME